MAGYWPHSFFACLRIETESTGPINTQKRTRPISSHLDRTSLVNKGFIILLSGKFFLRYTTGSPERARRSGSQSYTRFHPSCPLTALAILYGWTLVGAYYPGQVRFCVFINTPRRKKKYLAIFTVEVWSKKEFIYRKSCLVPSRLHKDKTYNNLKLVRRGAGNHGEERKLFFSFPSLPALKLLTLPASARALLFSPSLPIVLCAKKKKYKKSLWRRQ